MTAPFLEKISLSSHDQVPATAWLIGRIPSLRLPDDRKKAWHIQQPLQRKIVEALFPTDRDTPRFSFVYADQVHGAAVSVVKPPFVETQEISQVDGLMTSYPDVILGITVADCAPVWMVEKQGRAGALIHSGKKGTEAGIVPKAIVKMCEEFQIQPDDLIVTIGPCIRPPCYEIDFAHHIRQQATEAGVEVIQDSLTCTACHLDRYYSYRREKAKTGHMLAVLQLHQPKK